MAMDTIIPKKRRLTLKFIAENGPSSILRVKEGTRRDYKNVYVDVTKLAEAGLIRKVKGWDVTLPGLVASIDFGANPSKILGRLEENEQTAKGGNIAHLFGWICEFAIKVGIKNWAKETSRALLLVRFMDEGIGGQETATARVGDFPWDQFTPETETKDIDDIASSSG